VKQRKVTECVPGSERYEKSKNGRLMLKCKCSECGITKTKFVKQEGGALARRRGPTAVDKAAYIMSNFVTPAPSFAGLARILAGQAFKGVKDNVDHYRGRGKGNPLGKAFEAAKIAEQITRKAIPSTNHVFD